jgi:uncharacterized protein (TIGR02466 family)
MQTERPADPQVAGRLMKETYFPTQIYFKDLPDPGALNVHLRERILAWREQDPLGIERSNLRRLDAWHSAVDMHTRSEYDDLTRQIFGAVQQIYDDLGYDPSFEPACDSMWANVNPRYGFNRHHTHPNVLWSGVYYVQAPENCGRIYFTDPRPQAHVLTPRFAPDHPRPREAWNEVYYQPIEGRLILFPAWLVHEVQPNLSTMPGPDGERISVSFNFFQRQRGARPNIEQPDASGYTAIVAANLDRVASRPDRVRATSSE